MRQSQTAKPYRILVVDDDWFVRELIIDILADAGYATSEACCADDALDLFFGQPEIAGEIAAVVTDIDMPGDLDGIGLAARLNEAWPQVGVVVTSGSHRGMAPALRPAVFLAKPFRAEVLVNAIGSVIDAGRQSAHLRAS